MLLTAKNKWKTFDKKICKWEITLHKYGHTLCNVKKKTRTILFILIILEYLWLTAIYFSLFILFFPSSIEERCFHAYCISQVISANIYLLRFIPNTPWFKQTLVCLLSDLARGRGGRRGVERDVSTTQVPLCLLMLKSEVLKKKRFFFV